MNKKTQKKYVALLTLLAMVICTMFCTNTAKADTDLPWETSEVKKVSKCTINGIERTLTLLKKGNSYIQIGDSDPVLVSFNMPEVGEFTILMILYVGGIMICLLMILHFVLLIGLPKKIQMLMLMMLNH